MKTLEPISKSVLTAGLTLLSLLMPMLGGCTKGKQEQQMKKPPVPVTAEAASVKSVPMQLLAIGTVEPFSQVSVRSRIGGELIKVYFREGQDVRKGDLLFTIDPRPFKNALEVAEANMERDVALAKKAREDVNRYTELMREELVSRSQYEQIFATARALDATVSADRAAVENARLLLSYCSIHAPVSGRTGGLLVHEGNQIKADDDKAIVVINQVQPIYVGFSVPEKSLPDIKKYMAHQKLKVEVRITGEEDKPVYGDVQFIDNTVDTTTGTIKLKGIFPNRDNRLWPGQFVNAVMTLSVQDNAVVVPSASIQTSQQGHFVYLIKEDMTAEMRPVTTGQSFQNITVISAGLQPGEKVVTDGQMRLTPGSQVEIRTAPEARSREQGTESKEKVQQETGKSPATEKSKTR